MPTSGQITLQLVHDLALLYLCLACGTNDQLAEEGQHVIALKLRQWLPDKDPALIDHVIRDATLTYRGGMGTDALDGLIRRLASPLSEPLRLKVLHDLADVARADEVIRASEKTLEEKEEHLQGDM